MGHPTDEDLIKQLAERLQTPRNKRGYPICGMEHTPYNHPTLVCGMEPDHDGRPHAWMDIIDELTRIRQTTDVPKSPNDLYGNPICGHVSLTAPRNVCGAKPGHFDKHTFDETPAPSLERWEFCGLYENDLGYPIRPCVFAFSHTGKHSWENQL